MFVEMHYNRNMPKEVVYGTQSLFGLGLHDYYIEQGINQISTLVGHIRQASDTGDMMRIELQWCQTQAGTNSHLLEDPTNPCWIMSIQDFLRTYGLRIDLTSCTIPVLQCAGDEFIMDALREQGGCTSTELVRLNACRVLLQVARLSDIASADGRTIRDDILKGTVAAFYASRNRWPRQGRPPWQWWNLWRQKLKTAFSIDGSVPTLRHKLGTWNRQMHFRE